MLDLRILIIHLGVDQDLAWVSIGQVHIRYDLEACKVNRVYIYIHTHECSIKHMLSVYKYDIYIYKHEYSKLNLKHTHTERAWKSTPIFQHLLASSLPGELGRYLVNYARWISGGACFSEITNQKCNQRINQLSIQIIYIYTLYTHNMYCPYMYI